MGAPRQHHLKGPEKVASTAPDGDGAFHAPTDSSEDTTRYQDIVEDSTTGVVVADRKTRRIAYCNDAMRKFYRMSPGASVIGKPVPDIVSPYTALLSDAELDALATDRYTEYHRMHEDRYLGIRARALTWNGVDSYILYVSDETLEHQKRLQREEMMNLVPMGIGIYEIGHGDIKQIYMNDGYFRMVGETRSAREQTQHDFLRLVYPDDLPTVHAAIDRIDAGSQQELIDHRILCGDGTYRWFRLNASVAKREHGVATLYCSYVDIDEAVRDQKAVEDANLVLEKRYRQELSQRKTLEQGSMVAIQFNVTQDRLISDRVYEGQFDEFDEGTAGTAIRPDIAGRIPTPEERRIAADFFDRDKSLVRFQNGIQEFSAEYRRRFNDGRLYWLHATCHMDQDEESGDVISYTYMRNIDVEHKKELTAESVIDEETDFVMLLNTVSDMVMLLRVRNSYGDIGHMLYQEFPFRHVIDLGEFDVVVSEDRQPVLDFFQKDALVEKLKTTTVVTIMYRHRHADGTVRRKKTRAFYLDSTHEDIVIARRDITDIYDEEQEQKRELQAALDEATSASVAKSDFLSRMSHDLRTPMNVIIGLASLAMDEADDSQKMEKALSGIIDSSKYLLSLINDCLDLEKIDSGKVELRAVPYPYVDFYNDIKAMIEPQCREKDITLVMDEVDHVLPVIVADKMRIEQVFYNLLSNAVKFTPEGGTVEMLTRNIVVSEGQVSFDSVVRDNGIGMSGEFQQHMFEPFAQETNDMAPEYHGTGLGLAIVKQLTEAMGATITVKSEKGVGTEYRLHFRFPVAHETSDAAERPAPVSTERLRGKRVLLVEDHPMNRLIAQKLLEKAGMVVTPTENGQDALDRFTSVSEHFFDAILMDIRMPVMDGLEATREIRALDRADAKTIPIVAMTANAFDTDREKSLRAGMTAHLSKPIEPRMLYETLADLIG